MNKIIVSGPLDDIRSAQVRFLQEASRLGLVHVLLWTDAAIEKLTAAPPKFPLAERTYFLESLRFVESVAPYDVADGPHALPAAEADPEATWVVDEDTDNEARRSFCETHRIGYRVLHEEVLRGLPIEEQAPAASSNKKVIVTGCYDWFHSGHIRFFEEVSQLGDLYVVVGHDANIKLLKGEGHPMFSEDDRRYMVAAIRHVSWALVSSGDGWLDAEPEIERIRPDIYAVNEDGDRPEKREYCQTHGIEYRVLKRTPKQGLPRRQSTDLRGF